MNDPVEKLRQKHLKDKIPCEAAYHEMTQLARQSWHKSEALGKLPENVKVLRSAIERLETERSEAAKRERALRDEIEDLKGAVAPNSPLENLRMIAVMERALIIEGQLTDAVRAGHKMKSSMEKLNSTLRNFGKRPKKKR